jgi:T5SS/PEP-CTERM-associated repeat protein/autotransporter-associated beta strand protein
LALEGITAFDGTSTAANATFTNLGGTVANAPGGLTLVRINSTAASGHFTSQAGAVAGARGGRTGFAGNATAGNATLVANGGAGLGGSIGFFEDSVGGTARVEVYGNGFLDTRGHNSSVTIASIAGDGRIYLGDRGLAVGIDNSDSTFPGTIEPGPALVSGGPIPTLGTLTKVGTGTLTLTGTSTNASTIVNGGLLRIANGGTVMNLSPTSSNPGATIASTVGSTGAAIVEGANSLWSGDMAVGLSGTGELSVLDGGALDNSNLLIARNTNSAGIVTVDGTGSVATSGSVILVGARGTGVLNLQNDAVIHAGSVFLGEIAASSGIFNIGSGGDAGILDTFQVNGLLGSATLNFNHSESSHYFTRDGLAAGMPVLIAGSTAVNHLGSGTTILTAANTYTGDTTLLAGTLSIEQPFLSDAADVSISAGATFDLNFNGMDAVNSLYIGGMPKLVGTHGAIGSGADFEWSVITGTGLLQVTSFAGTPGDFDADGDVDGRDFLIWQRNPAVGDLGDWQANYRVGTTTGLSSSAVPEPASWMILLCGAILATRHRVRKSAIRSTPIA